MKKALAVALVSVITGCAITRPHRSKEALLAHREQFIREVIERRTALGRCVVGRMELEQAQWTPNPGPKVTLDMLIISGGGDYGAFGAGVLKGWGQVREPKFQRPRFDLVTGVSTGALIAPFAFVGTEEAYEQAFCVYRNPKPQWFRLRNILSILLVRRSFIDNSGLKDEIRNCMTDQMIADISDGQKEHRLLLIGTTNLDLGMLTMWDATRLAHEVAEEGRTRDHFDDVILASTAIPAVFPPVEIEGDLYVDGGVTRNIAYMTDQEFENSEVNLWKKTHPNVKFPRTRIWVIVNKQLGSPPEQIHSTWPAVTARSLDVSVRASTISSLKTLALNVQNLRMRKGMDIEFRYIAIPDEWTPPVKGNFKKETMNALAELGMKMGADFASWRDVVPNPESPQH